MSKKTKTLVEIVEEILSKEDLKTQDLWKSCTMLTEVPDIDLSNVPSVTSFWTTYNENLEKKEVNNKKDERNRKSRGSS